MVALARQVTDRSPYGEVSASASSESPVSEGRVSPDDVAVSVYSSSSAASRRDLEGRVARAFSSNPDLETTLKFLGAHPSSIDISKIPLYLKWIVSQDDCGILEKGARINLANYVMITTESINASTSFLKPKERINIPQAVIEMQGYMARGYRCIVQGKRLGEGKDGEVYLSFLSKNGKKIKLVAKKFFLNAEAYAEISAHQVFPYEDSSLRDLPPLHIVKRSADEIWVFFQKADQDFFAKHIDSAENRLLKSPDSFRDDVRVILKKLAVLHREKIVVADLKPENILCGIKGEPNFLSFCDHSGTGYAGAEKMKGTAAYSPPECRLGKMVLSVENDLWVVGVILYGIIFGTSLASGTGYCFSSQDELDTWIRGHSQRFPEILYAAMHNDPTGEGRDLLFKLLQVDHKKRLTAEEALKHPYFGPLSTSVG